MHLYPKKAKMTSQVRMWGLAHVCSTHTHASNSIKSTGCEVSQFLPLKFLQILKNDAYCLMFFF